MFKFIINFILRRWLNFDFIKEMPEEKRLGIYARMKDKDILDLLKYLYTNNYAEYILADGDKALILKGRIVQLLDILNTIETAEDSLLRITEYKKKVGEAKQILTTIKNPLYKKHLIADERSDGYERKNKQRFNMPFKTK